MPLQSISDFRCKHSMITLLTLTPQASVALVCQPEDALLQVAQVSPG